MGLDSIWFNRIDKRREVPKKRDPTMTAALYI